MSRSSKIIVASCLCAAFLTVGISCTVEDRDVEEKGVFLCKSNADCLDSSSLCVKAHEEGTPEYEEEIGRCIRKEEIDHCRDNDKDGYYIASEQQYVNECGFSETNPQDLDDSNPLVYPGAPELCDGKDNSGDGCVDGIKNDSTGECEPIENPCWGVGKVKNYDNSVCSAALIGYEKCVDGKMVYQPPTSSSSSFNLGRCPSDASKIPGYSEKELCDTAVDDNCDTKVNEECVNCSEQKTKTPYCYVTSDSNYKAQWVTSKDDSNYKLVLAECEGGSCPCIGEAKCESETSSPVCAFSGQAITSTSISGNKCENTFKD
ncbi:MAG: putative metal-binding motif-containing protein [Proteobacteria bacterium]|nr:putative metal-binding motif-containing protein [Pseudomonadota bacterium]